MDIQLTKVKVSLPNGKRLFAVEDLRIPYGTHILIQGASGTGKTTLLHLIAGLFYPQEGAVLIGDSKITSLEDDELCELRRQKIGVIFQKLNLLDHLTVEENIRLSAPGDAGAIEAAMEQVKLSGRGGDRCSYLSLGEQQRVAVARVLAQNPGIILADEPTSSLDEKNGRFVLSALKSAARGKTLIVVSHDKRISDQFDRVIAFEDFTK